MSETVAVLGASPKVERYSNRAILELAQHGHRVLPVNPACDAIHGHPCYKNLETIDSTVDTLTLYVGAARSAELQQAILGLKPKRIIMNPGAENDSLEQQAQTRGIEVVRGCTLVMLQTGQF